MILICGMDGYIGWALAMHLARHGEGVCGIDRFLRREWVAEVGSHSATPILEMGERLSAFTEVFGKEMAFEYGDLRDYGFVERVMEKYRPDSIVHLGEQPSAPYSMIDASHASFTQTNNIVGTLNILYAMHRIVPRCHLVKLGTMGEYGTPNVDIPEGFFEIEYRGRKDRLPFPRQASSFYHLTKVHDTNNIMFACRVWGLRSTDIMQGVVYGISTDETSMDPRLHTRFDFDGIFGTAINRYCAQAVLGVPLTPFGKGHQKRGFIALRDSIQCLALAIRHPPEEGEYRVFNQFDEVYDVTQLAIKVREASARLGLEAEIANIQNPRVEAEEHYYKPDHARLAELGFRPKIPIEEELHSMLSDLVHYRERIAARSEAIAPRVRWRA